MIWFQIVYILILVSNIHALILISANFVGLSDYSRSLPYVDLIEQSRKWGSPGTPWDGNGTFDSITGWPTADFGVIIVSDNLDMGGIYLLYANGNAEISEPIDRGTQITNKIYDATTNTLTALVNVPQNTTQIMLSFRNTTGPGLQNISWLQPNYNISSKSDITNLTLAHISRFSLLRFMDWTDTNGNPEENWSDNTHLNWPQYTTRRNPWQTIPFIANQLNQSMDIWINIPLNASEDYIVNVAKIMLNELNPSNNIYVEYQYENRSTCIYV
mgnify:CR=1 FL=1